MIERKQGLKEKTINSFFWVSIDSFGQRIFQFIVSIILARLLMPSEFGMLGMLLVFIAFSRLFIDSGFSFALIRKRYVTQIEFDTVFWFNILTSIIFYLALFVLAPFIADFYKQPILKDLVRVVGLNLVINAIGSIQNIYLKRNLLFKQLTIIGLTSKILSGIISIIMALHGFGVWSLVIQELFSNIIKTILLVITNRYYPRFRASWNAFKILFSFSSKLLYSGIIYSIVSNVYPMVIGKFFTASDVGYFTRASSLQQLPVGFFTGIIQQVTLPSFSKINDDDIKLKYVYKKAIKLASFTILLPLVLLTVTAQPLIELLLTKKWLPSAHMLQIFALSGIFYPLSALNVNLIGVKGRSDYVMYLQFLKDALTIIGVIIGVLFGIYGLVISYTITSVLSYLLNAYFANKVLPYSISEQMIDLLPFVLISILTGLIAIVFSSFFDYILIKLLVAWSTGILIYFILAKIFKFDEITELQTIINQFIKKKNG